MYEMTGPHIRRVGLADPEGPTIPARRRPNCAPRTRRFAAFVRPGRAAQRIRGPTGLPNRSVVPLDRSEDLPAAPTATARLRRSEDRPTARPMIAPTVSEPRFVPVSSIVAARLADPRTGGPCDLWFDSPAAPRTSRIAEPNHPLRVPSEPAGFPANPVRRSFLRRRLSRAAMHDFYCPRRWRHKASSELFSRSFSSSTAQDGLSPEPVRLCTLRPHLDLGAVDGRSLNRSPTGRSYLTPQPTTGTPMS
jgi:hypothetical protein